MSVYSQDLRRRVVQAYERRILCQTGSRFMVNPATVRDWMKLQRTTGSLKAKPCDPKPQDVQAGTFDYPVEDNDATKSWSSGYRSAMKTSKSSVDRWCRKDHAEKRRFMKEIQSELNS